MTQATSTKSSRSTKAPAAKNVRKPRSSGQPDRVEILSQFTLKMRESLHRELARKALDSNMTMRGYIMHALRDSGLRVLESDLVDRRRR
ncbi:MAG: putative HicB family RNase H-like nuclease [Candidatus Azotimanducaceae bacterium]|jgi:predicted HicB family RNase H-like nuclease